MQSAVVFVSLAVGLCGASVDFTHSTLYDINDFIGQEKVFIHKCDYGCVIFASTMGEGFVENPSGYDPYAEKLLIHNNKDGANYSITDLSRSYYETSTKKRPLTITGPASITVLNVNTNDAPWPIALYVVEKSKAAEFSYEVYDAINMRGISINPNSITTVMSVSGFNLMAQKNGMKNGVTARLVGFDNALDSNSDNCPVAYSTATQPTFPGFNLNIDGPLISLLFNERNPVKIDASIGIIPLFDLSDDGFITPGGYNGCKKPLSGGLQSFRSVLMEKSNTYIVDSSKHRYSVAIDVIPNMDDNHNVIITDGGTSPAFRKEVVTGNTLVSYAFDNTDYLQIEFINLSGDQGFLLKYWAAELPDNGPTESTSVSSTSTSTSSTTTMTPTTSGSQGIGNTILSIIAAVAIARML